MATFLNLLTACISLATSIIGLVILKNNQPNHENKQGNHVTIKNNSGTVNQYANSYNYTNIQTHTNKTQIVYTTSSRKDTTSGDIVFVIIFGLLWFPYSTVLEDYQWVIKLAMLIVQAAIVFCIYKKIQICLPSKSEVSNTIFLISPALLLFMSEIPSLFSLYEIDFGDVFLATARKKIYQSGYLLITYLAFIMMLFSHISSVISPKVANMVVKRFFEGVGRLWVISLFFQIIALFLIVMPNILF